MTNPAVANVAGVVGAGLDRGAGMIERCGLVRGVETAAHDSAVSWHHAAAAWAAAIVRLELERLAKQRQRLVGIPRHRHHGVRQGAQVEIVGVEVFRALALGALDLGLAQARLDASRRRSR